MTYFLKIINTHGKTGSNIFDNHFFFEILFYCITSKSLKGQWPLLVEAAAMGKLGEEAAGGVGGGGRERLDSQTLLFPCCPRETSQFPAWGTRGQKVFSIVFLLLVNNYAND